MFRASFRKELVCTSGETGNAEPGPYQQYNGEAFYLCSPFHKSVLFVAGIDGTLTLRKNRRVYGEKFKLASTS